MMTSNKQFDFMAVVRGILGAGIFAIAIIGATEPASAFSYDESVSSDLSSDSTFPYTPTSLGTLAPGTNIVSGSVDAGAGDTFDFMSFTVPVGLAVDTLTFATLGGSGIAWEIYGEGAPGSGELVLFPFASAFSSGPGPVNLIPTVVGESLFPGFYGILLVDVFGTGPVSYELVFNESSVVPIPAALPLLLTGLLGLCAIGWQRRKAT